jgi:hypothetical protein
MQDSGGVLQHFCDLLDRAKADGQLLPFIIIEDVSTEAFVQSDQSK